MVIHPSDNVEVRADGHKYALRPIAKGENVIKYGFPIGYAKEDVAAGAHIHVHNLHTNLSGELEYTWNPTWPANETAEPATFMGYPRKDGKVGVRNELWILPTVGCVNDIAKALEKEAQKLIGGDWKIDLKLVEENAEESETDFAEEKQRRTEALSNVLGVSVETAELLVSNGFLSLEGLSELSEEDLRAIKGLSDEDASIILDKIAESKS